MDDEAIKKDSAYLKNWINRILDDTGQPFIQKAAIFPHGDMRSERFEFINDLQRRKIAIILNDPASLREDEPLLEMLSYIDRKSAIPGFLESSPINPL